MPGLARRFLIPLLCFPHELVKKACDDTWQRPATVARASLKPVDVGSRRVDESIRAGIVNVPVSMK